MEACRQKNAPAGKPARKERKENGGGFYTERARVGKGVEAAVPTALRSKRGPNRLRISFAMVPQDAAMSQAEMDRAPELPRTVTVSPGAASGIAETSTRVWSMQIRPKIGARRP